MRTTLGQAGGFKLIDQQDHRAAIDSHRRAELLLDGALASAEHVEKAEEGRGQTHRLKRLRNARMGRPPEAEEELTGELRDLDVG